MEDVPPHLMPLSLANWLQAIGGESQPRYVMEYPLYTDCQIDGDDVVLGPYYIKNSSMYCGPVSNAQPALHLRIGYHYEYDSGSVSDGTRYHGGWVSDEVASLICLGLGVRLEAGPQSRSFAEGADPFGTPEPWDFRPILTGPRRSTMLPTLPERPTLDAGLGVLRKYAFIHPATAHEVIKCARLYQRAVWTAEYDPNYAWLMLVGAVEVAAEAWRSTKANLTPVEWANSLRKGLGDEAVSQGSDKILGELAKSFLRVTRSTAKFLDFMVSHLPPPPEVRPERDLVDFNVEPMRAALAQVYSLRSTALHGGSPMPKPMTDAPGGKGGVYAERPSGQAIQWYHASWAADEVPMHLHIFEYLVRSALLKWIYDLPKNWDGDSVNTNWVLFRTPEENRSKRLYPIIR